MAIVYPAALDTFSVPTLPEGTSLSSAGTSTRNHTQSHDDLGKAVMALEANATPLAHDHSTTDGDSIWPTNKLLQANTHQSADTDSSLAALHHTIGTLPTQAAAGNHAHDYTGPSIFNKPVYICTTLTRPLDPLVGTLIYETDTNTARVWAEFPGNTTVAGTNFTYTFNTDNDTAFLDPAVFSQTYVVGTSPTDGVMAAPSAGVCAWGRGANVTSQCVARGVKTGSTTTVTDDQVLTWTTGTIQLQEHFGSNASPTNDGYLRMSADEQSYVRFSNNDQGSAIYYTTSGPSGEALLGAVKATTSYPKTTWTAKAIGSTYVLYAAGQQVLAVVDYQNVVTIGSSNRGWGIGMTAGQGASAQTVPCSLSSINIADVPYHTENLIWQLLNMAAVPHIRAEAHFAQVVIPGNKGSVVGFSDVLFDWNLPYTNFDVSQTDITIQEPGHYHVHVSVPWDPDFFGFDEAAVGITLNGQDISRKTVQFMRGNGFAPGYPQTVDLFFTYYFALGDILRIHAQHNASVNQWLFWSGINPDHQTCWVELDFMGP